MPNTFFLDSTGGLDVVIPDAIHTLPIRIEVPATVNPGTSYEGTVHLREGKRTIPATLKVAINVVAPSNTSVPTEITLPSSNSSHSAP